MKRISKDSFILVPLTRSSDCSSACHCQVPCHVLTPQLTLVLCCAPPDHDLGAFTFVLRSSDSSVWYKDADQNFFIPVPSQKQPKLEKDPTEGLDPLSKAIVDAENSSAWTLMHRYGYPPDAKMLNQ